jgi:hypothetical protein
LLRCRSQQAGIIDVLSSASRMIEKKSMTCPSVP